MSAKLDSLFAELVEQQAAKRLPPVHLWQPENVGRIDISIDAEGRWSHDGDPIQRQPLIDLFATILRLDDGQHYLVTPHEKLAIEVADAPFVVVDFAVEGQGTDQQCIVTTNVGDHCLLDTDHPVVVRDGVPYVDIRGGLLAKFSRNAFYQLVEIGAAEADEWIVYSFGERINLGSIT